MRERLLELDTQYTHRLNISRQNGMTRRIAVLFAHSGDSWFWLFGLGILWLLGNELWKARAQLMFASILVTAAVVLAIKFTVRRKRPEGEWGNVYRSTDPHSFPSGHAVRAFMLAVLALGLGPGWFGVLLAVWAPLVALARVSMGVHYLSDILAGAVFGMLTGAVLLYLLAF